MKAAVLCNVRTAHQCWAEGIESGFAIAVRGGSILGFALVSLGLLSMLGVIALFKHWNLHDGDLLSLYEALAGFGLGASVVALFGRVGGGIYTKAADVGADLSGKNEYGMDEDDPRNPACIADNVGDNVGDIAGMGADLFGSFAESTCAALIICAKTFEVDAGENNSAVAGLANTHAGMSFPILVSSVGVVVGIVTMFLILNLSFFRVREVPQIESTLKQILILSTLLETVAVGLVAKFLLPSEFRMVTGAGLDTVTYWSVLIPVWMGLWSGLLIGIATEYYTSHSNRPVREIAETQRISAATGIIYGLALGYLSCLQHVV